MSHFIYAILKKTYKKQEKHRKDEKLNKRKSCKTYAGICSSGVSGKHFPVVLQSGDYQGRRVLGETSLAAVGATTAVSTLLIGFLQGLTNGFAIGAAQSFGSGKTERLRKAAAGTLLLGTLTTLAITVLALAGLEGFLKILNVPETLYAEAKGYIQIVLAGMMVTMLYNACAGILRTVGDTVAPLLFLMCAALLNVGLDILFMAVVPLGVQGAALGTVLAQLVSVVFKI